MRRRHGRRRSSDYVLTFLLLLVLGMGVGYSVFSATLTINSTSDIDRVVWDVHFENVQVKSGSVTASTPTITNDTTVSFNVTLSEPNTYYQFSQSHQFFVKVQGYLL